MENDTTSEVPLKSEIRNTRAEIAHRISHDRRVFFMALLAGLPGVVVAMILLWRGDFTPKVQWTLTVLIISVWLGLVASIRQRVVFPLQTLSNLLAALREGDYSIRGREAREHDALGEVTRGVRGTTPHVTSLTGQESRGERGSGLIQLVRERGYVDQINTDTDSRH